MKKSRYGIPIALLMLSFFNLSGKELLLVSGWGVGIALHTDSLEEKEVPIAHRTIPLKEVTGAVSLITSENLIKSLDLNPLGALKGKAAGLYVSEEPGAHREGSFSLNIRGQSGGKNTSSPLLIVDGIERPFEYLQYEEIESISVLKDAVSKGFYKGREANGVVLVTTKRGKQGVYENRVSLQTGVSAPTILPKFTGSAEYASLYNLARRNSGLSNIYSEEDINAYAHPTVKYPSNDYHGVLLKDSRGYTKIAASFSGGDSKLRYFINSGYLRSGGLEAVGNENSMNQFNIRSNLDYKVSEVIGAFLDVSAFVDANNTNYLQSKELFTRMSTQRPNEYALLLRDHIDQDSTLYGASRYSTSATYQNLYAEMSHGGFRENTQRVGQTNMGVNLDFAKYLQGLKGRMMFSFDTYNGLSIGKNDNFYSYIPIWDKQELAGETLATVGNKNANMSRLATDGYRRFALNGELGYQHLWNRSRLDTRFIWYGERTINMFDNYRSSFQSNVMMINYAFRNTLFVDVSGGLIGSSRLPNGDNYGFFPAVGLSWLISEEDFFPVGNTVNFLKVRTSYGITGNDQSLRQFGYKTRWNYLANASHYTYFGVDAATLARVATIESEANKDLRWEKSYELNLGVDLRLFERLHFSADYYRMNRQNVPSLQEAIYSQIGGITNRQINYVGIINNGIDATATFKGGNDRFVYTASVNLNYSESKYSVGPSWTDMPEARNLSGKLVDSYIGYVSSGIIRNSSELASADQRLGDLGVGDLLYRDLDGNGHVDQNDMKTIGNAFPKMQYGFQLSADYQRFGVSISGYGAEGYDVYLNNVYYRPNPETSYSVHTRKMYNPEINAGTFPRLTMTNSTNNYQLSDFWLKSGNFLRIKEAEFRYTFPELKTNRIGLDRLTLFVRGNNLLTFSKLKDVDPEYINAGITGYPFMRTYTAGINIIF